ncbi:hypothetical protein JHK85_000799 [Glycine max]|uniref:Cullin-associated NEDD8-dissociated protein 1 n=1 Tax=Glycine soja TaxID=3848 RepID=A0A0B2SRK1_GLYSO|nr:hypothetical protein JHK85_000799 [Glycine max]KHN47518.1 Cullin-associated NEDD8-dissociated protein 1 [Glycine soja]
MEEGCLVGNLELRGNAKVIGPEQVVKLSQKVVARILLGVGFEGAMEGSVEDFSEVLSGRICKTRTNLRVLADSYKKQCSAIELLKMLLKTVGFSDSNLHMIALALELCCTLMGDKRSNQSIGLAVRNKVLPQALTLIKSSLLQGQALSALQNVFAALVYSANTSIDYVLESLFASAKPSPQSGGIAKQALHSIAQCVTILCLVAGDQKCSSTVKMLTDILKDDNSSNSVSFSLQ